MVPVSSALVILVFVTSIAAVFAAHLFGAQDPYNFGPHTAAAAAGPRVRRAVPIPPLLFIQPPVNTPLAHAHPPAPFPSYSAGRETARARGWLRDGRPAECGSHAAAGRNERMTRAGAAARAQAPSAWPSSPCFRCRSPPPAGWRFSVSFSLSPCCRGMVSFPPSLSPSYPPSFLHSLPSPLPAAFSPSPPLPPAFIPTLPPSFPSPLTHFHPFPFCFPHSIPLPPSSPPFAFSSSPPPPPLDSSIPLAHARDNPCLSFALDLVPLYSLSLLRPWPAFSFRLSGLTVAIS